MIVASFTPGSAANNMMVPTIVRARGQVSVAPDVASADVDIVGAIGMGVVTEEAFAAGEASIPGPFGGADWDGWFVWRSFSMRYEFHTAASTLLLDQRWEVDSKAMRKVPQGLTIVLMAESQTGAYDLSMPIRLLLKLS